MFQHVGVFTQLLLLKEDPVGFPILSKMLAYDPQHFGTLGTLGTLGTFGTFGTFGPGSHLLQHLDERPGKGRQVVRSLAPL